MRKKVISLSCGAVLAASLWTCYMQTNPATGREPSPLCATCLMASLPGLFISLLFSSGNHGIGVGITDNRIALTTVGIGTNALLYGWLTWLIWGLVARLSRKTNPVPGPERSARY